ncbi:MAG: hypothetical protein ACHQX3_02795, partial [Nitrospirales bacterium]
HLHDSGTMNIWYHGLNGKGHLQMLDNGMVAFGMAEPNDCFFTIGTGGRAEIVTDQLPKIEAPWTDVPSLITVDEDGILHSGTVMYSGRTNVTNSATSLVIQIGHTMPSTNYTPSVSFLAASPVASAPLSYSDITQNSFTVNFGCGISGDADLAWSVIYSP